MDIFTTQLTRVVPVPIKKEQLKVKALVKDSAAGKLTDDIDHIENHEIFFKESENNDKETDQESKPDEEEHKKLKQEGQSIESNDSKISTDKDGHPHLDIYV